jgi:hypothetical protein
MEHKDKPITTSRTEDGHGGTKTAVMPTVTQRRYHAGNPDTSGQNQVPDAGGPVLLHRQYRHG